VADEPSALIQYALAASLGGLTGVSELVTRYRDSPRRLVKMLSFHGYWLGNAAAACLALLLAHSNQIQFGENQRAPGWLTEVVVASFGAMLLLRSAIVVIIDRNGKPTQAGPGAAITAILEFIEDVINRNQGHARSDAINKIMTDVDFDKAVINLPPICLRLMSRTSAQAVVELTDKVEKLQKEAGDPAAKSVSLGAILIEFCGEDVLSGAIRASWDVVKVQGAMGRPPVAASRRPRLKRRKAQPELPTAAPATAQAQSPPAAT
jgi:hypothetical protein